MDDLMDLDVDLRLRGYVRLRDLELAGAPDGWAGPDAGTCGRSGQPRELCGCCSANMRLR